MLRAITIVALLSAAGAARAQSDVDPEHKLAWGENIGWLNWRDAGDPAGDEGVRLHPGAGGSDYLSGFVWAENVGWINLGDGSPDGGDAYGNTDGADTGVNIDPDGTLRGLGWGENIGWVNFDTEAALGAFGQHARMDAAAGRLRGYAWGENVGWINLDHHEHYVGFVLACPPDFNGDGLVDTRDVLAFLNAWSSGDPRADFNGDGLVDTRDVLAFLNAWTAGCA